MYIACVFVIVHIKGQRFIPMPEDRGFRAEALVKPSLSDFKGRETRIPTTLTFCLGFYVLDHENRDRIEVGEPPGLTHRNPPALAVGWLTLGRSIKPQAFYLQKPQLPHRRGHTTTSSFPLLPSTHGGVHQTGRFPLCETDCQTSGLDFFRARTYSA